MLRISILLAAAGLAATTGSARAQTSPYLAPSDPYEKKAAPTQPSPYYRPAPTPSYAPPKYAPPPPRYVPPPPKAKPAPSRPSRPVIPEQGPVAAPSLLGATGLLRLVSADGAELGAWHLGFGLEAWHGREIFATAPPDSHTHLGLRLQVAFAPTRWMELFAQVTGRVDANAVNANDPQWLFGDTLIGVKGCGWVSKTVCLGLMGAAQLLAPVSDVPFSVRSTSFHLRSMLTYDGTRAASPVPLRFHANVGAYIDNSNDLLLPSFSGVTRYSLRLNESSRLFFGMGAELRLSQLVAPFAEWSFEVPVGLPDRPGAPGASSYPHVVSLGARMFPKGSLAITLAADVGLAWNGRLGVPATPPWQFQLGISYGFGATPGTVPSASPKAKPSDDDF